MNWQSAVAAGIFALTLSAQTQPTTTFSRTVKNGEETVDIRNVSYELTGTGIPGRPADQHLVLRTTTHSMQIIGDIPEEGKVTLEAWPLGTAFTVRPIYSVTLSGNDARTVEGALWFVGRGDVDTEYWSVLKLATGQHLFDSYVLPVSFGVSRETLDERFVGLDVPLSDVKDARLKDPHNVALVEYSTQDKVLREALITSDDAKQASLLRGLEDTTRTLTQADMTLTIGFTANYPSAPSPVTIRVPVLKDDLDLAHAQLPKGLHISVFRR